MVSADASSSQPGRKGSRLHLRTQQATHSSQRLLCAAPLGPQLTGAWRTLVLPVVLATAFRRGWWGTEAPLLVGAEGEGLLL